MGDTRKPEITAEIYGELRDYLAKRRADIDIREETDYFSLLVNKLLVDETFTKDVQNAVKHANDSNDALYKELNEVLEKSKIYVDANSLLAFGAGEFTWASVSHIANLFGNKNIGTFN